MLALIIEIKYLRITYHRITCSRIKYSRNKCPRITCVSIRCTRIFLGFFGLIKELFVGQDCIQIEGKYGGLGHSYQ